jgi:CubicO group peptidase (beta-lactamase class C family)
LPDRPTAPGPGPASPAGTVNPADPASPAGTAQDRRALAVVDAIADRHQRRGGQPGLAYGIVAGGTLVHSGGLGQRWLGGQAPDADTVFRIASMTKSFTAAAVLALRDDGALALDDPARDYVPELAGLPPATADSPPVSIRQLLTMTAGFPTDDPWGDRQQGTPLAEFAEFLAGGISFAWAPGTRFEYSNLGYAILGRVITAVSGREYPDFVTERLLRPLGLSRTGYEAAGFSPAGLARGYRRGEAGWSEQEPAACGAFAPMGGIFSCVSDLARWVHGFAAAFPPGAEAAGGAHPLRRATRREMQLPQVALERRDQGQLPGGAWGGSVSYGFGLFVEDSRYGRIVHHAGGYPGFGSHMRWHPATGTGVIVLANSTYATVRPLAASLLDAMLGLQAAATPQAAARAGGQAAAPDHAGVSDQARVNDLAPAPGSPWPQTLTARHEVTRLLQSWDDTAAARLFAENVALDEPAAERRNKIELIRRRIGDFGDDPQRPAEFDSPAHCRWWLRGERGVTTAEIKLTPERPPRVQLLTVAVPPAADTPLARLLDTVISLLNSGAGEWPAQLPTSDALDTAVALRQLRVAAAWAGRCRRGAFLAGNGATSTTVELDGQAARLTVAVLTDPAGQLQQLDIGLRG